MKQKNKRHPRHWLKFGVQIFKLYLNQIEQTSDLVIMSYNKISNIYDRTWTDHMQHLSQEMLNRIPLPKGKKQALQVK